MPQQGRPQAHLRRDAEHLRVHDREVVAGQELIDQQLRARHLRGSGAVAASGCCAGSTPMAGLLLLAGPPEPVPLARCRARSRGRCRWPRPRSGPSRGSRHQGAGPGPGGGMDRGVQHGPPALGDRDDVPGRLRAGPGQERGRVTAAGPLCGPHPKEAAAPPLTCRSATQGTGQETRTGPGCPTRRAAAPAGQHARSGRA